jgi:hypothetical protein
MKAMDTLSQGCLGKALVGMLGLIGVKGLKRLFDSVARVFEEALATNKVSSSELDQAIAAIDIRAIEQQQFAEEDFIMRVKKDGFDMALISFWNL